MSRRGELVSGFCRPQLAGQRHHHLCIVHCGHVLDGVQHVAAALRAAPTESAGGHGLVFTLPDWGALASTNNTSVIPGQVHG